MKKQKFETHEKVDDYIAKVSDAFRPMCALIRRIYLAEGMTEEFKWNSPCYSYHGLVCSLSAFKKHVSTWFFQGALLSDPKHLLDTQSRAKAMRSIKFTDISQVDEKVLRAYVKEAMLLNELGIKVDQSKDRDLVIPEYFKSALAKNSAAKKHFNAFSYSKQKEYIHWVTGAKREETRARRVAQSIAMLAEGKGKEDKYRR